MTIATIQKWDRFIIINLADFKNICENKNSSTFYNGIKTFQPFKENFEMMLLFQINNVLYYFAIFYSQLINNVMQWFKLYNKFLNAFLKNIQIKFWTGKSFYRNSIGCDYFILKTHLLYQHYQYIPSSRKCNGF